MLVSVFMISFEVQNHKNMNIAEYYISLLEQFRTVHLAEREFRRQMDDDPRLSAEYAEWCEENDYSLRDGLREFGEEYMEEREQRWESLNDFDDE